MLVALGDSFQEVFLVVCTTWGNDEKLGAAKDVTERFLVVAVMHSTSGPAVGHLRIVPPSSPNLCGPGVCANPQYVMPNKLSNTFLHLEGPFLRGV